MIKRSYGFVIIAGLALAVIGLSGGVGFGAGAAFDRAASSAGACCLERSGVDTATPVAMEGGCCHRGAEECKCDCECGQEGAECKCAEECNCDCGCAKEGEKCKCAEQCQCNRGCHKS